MFGFSYDLFYLKESLKKLDSQKAKWFGPAGLAGPDRPILARVKPCPDPTQSLSLTTLSHTRTRTHAQTPDGDTLAQWAHTTDAHNLARHTRPTSGRGIVLVTGDDGRSSGNW